MRRFRFSLISSLGLAILLVLAAPNYAAAQSLSKSGKFLLGADISALDAHGRWPLPQYQENGKPGTEITILRNHGWNAFRVRVFVSPVRRAPDNTLAAAIPLAKEIKASGATFILDLHFSDTWADGGHQPTPAAWSGMDIKALAHEWQTYARDTVKAFKDAGAMPDIVQVGNEITQGADWPLGRVRIPGNLLPPPVPEPSKASTAAAASTQSSPAQSSPAQSIPAAPYNDKVQWKNFTRLLKAGIRGVKEGSGDTPPRIAIHIDRGGNWAVTEWFFDHLRAAHVPYDIIAQSFYPPWHQGTLEDLQNNMNQCDQRYHKDFLVMETGYLRPSVKNTSDMLWPVTPEGRLQFMVDLVNTVQKAPNGLGVIYWAPERDFWNADGTPGPVVFTLDKLKTLANSPDSHAPADVRP